MTATETRSALPPPAGESAKPAGSALISTATARKPDVSQFPKVAN